MEALIITEYCPVCERETSHRAADDDIFAYAIECMVCGTIWETEEPIEEE